MLFRLELQTHTPNRQRHKDKKAVTLFRWNWQTTQTHKGNLLHLQSSK
jgi:hypothetical protein